MDIQMSAIQKLEFVATAAAILREISVKSVKMVTVEIRKAENVVWTVEPVATVILEGLPDLIVQMEETVFAKEMLKGHPATCVEVEPFPFRKLILWDVWNVFALGLVQSVRRQACIDQALTFKSCLDRMV